MIDLRRGSRSQKLNLIEKLVKFFFFRKSMDKIFVAFLKHNMEVLNDLRVDNYSLFLALVTRVCQRHVAGELGVALRSYNEVLWASPHAREVDVEQFCEALSYLDNADCILSAFGIDFSTIDEWRNFISHESPSGTRNFARKVILEYFNECCSAIFGEDAVLAVFGRVQSCSPTLEIKSQSESNTQEGTV